LKNVKKRSRPSFVSANFKEISLTADNLKDEQKKAFDLLDSLSNSGSLVFDNARYLVV
jgi:hypothetical protein